jgi:hypothetical protein
MIRLAAAVVLILALVLQSVSAVVPSRICDHAHDWEHSALHIQNVSHHHHDADSVHIDDSNVSIGHLLEDLGGFSALLAHGWTSPPGREGSFRHAHDMRLGPQPPPDGLLRPPRLIA